MGGKFRFIVEGIFSIPGRGVVAKGRIEEGTVAVGDEIGFLGTDGKWTSAMVAAIEVSRRLVEQAEAGQEANILLEGIKKGQITRGTVLLEAPAAPVPVSAPPPARPYPPVVSTPSAPSMERAIKPSSGLWRTLILLGIGLLIVLALAYLEGKFG